MDSTITLPHIQKPSTVRAIWLSQHPWWSAPYYRCKGEYTLETHGKFYNLRGHAPDMACCWAKALQDWIAATRKETP